MSLYAKFMQDIMTVKATKPSKPNMGFCPECGWNSDYAHNGQFEPSAIKSKDCEFCNEPFFDEDWHEHEYDFYASRGECQ